MNNEISFSLTDDQLKKIEALGLEIGTTSKKDLINSALTLLDWATKQKKEGFTVGKLVASDKFYELEFPSLDSVRR